MSKRKNHNQGFLLMEVLVALAVMATGVLFLLQSFSVIVRSNRQLRNNQTAYRLIDAIYNRLYAGEKLSPETPVFPGGERYAWSSEVTPLGNRLQQLALSVTWPEKGRTANISFAHTMLKK